MLHDSSLLYRLIRLLVELLIVGIVVFVLTEFERKHSDLIPLIDMMRIHAVYGLVVLWLARWEPATIWLTGALYILGMLFLMLWSAAMFFDFPLYFFAFATVILAAYLLGKSQHRTWAK